VQVVIGEDDGATVQIVSGLNPGDQIIQDPPDSLIDGEKVTVVQPGSMPTPAGGCSHGEAAQSVKVRRFIPIGCKLGSKVRPAGCARD
jgi:hypothetical protein